MGKRVGMISLGCAKNQVNAEQMLYRLQQAGYTLQEDVDGADLVIVNTCGFIDSAKSEAIDNILAMGALKQEGRIGRLLVTGCLSQRYQDEILQEMPEVDGVLGTGSYDDIVSVADRLLNGGETVSEFGDIDAPADEAGRVLTTPQHYAYIKIAEGCNNFCAFCIIPHLRGTLPQPRRGGHPAGGPRPCGVRRQGADRRRAGHEPLRHGPVRRAAPSPPAARAVPH